MFCKLWEGLRRQHGPVLLLVAMTAGAALIVPVTLPARRPSPARCSATSPIPAAPPSPARP